MLTWLFVEREWGINGRETASCGWCEWCADEVRYRRRREECWGGGGIGQGGYLYQQAQSRAGAIVDGKLDARSDQQSCRTTTQASLAAARLRLSY
jgi:hypothetical protein